MLSVKSRIIPILALGGLLGAVESNAGTLVFEDLNPTPASFDLMPSSYGGFNFSGWFYGPDTLYAPASGTIDLFTDYADPNDPTAYVITVNNSITRAAKFYFDGAWFSGYSGVTFELWEGGALVGMSATLADAAGASPYGPTWLASGYGGLVDTVRVSGVQGYYSMDDFSFHEAGSGGGSVPVPGTWSLAGLALGLAYRSKARRAGPA